MLWAPLLLLPAVSPLQSPKTLELQDLDGLPALKVKVGGQERLLALVSYWPKSSLLDGSGTVRSVSIGGASVPVRFGRGVKSDMMPGADGVLGVDALRKVSFAFDTLYSTVEVLPRTKIGLAGAKAYFAKLPSWGGPTHIVKIPLGRTMQGAPTVKGTLNRKARPFTLTLSPYNSTLGKTVAAGGSKREEAWNFLPRFSVTGLAPRWLCYGYYPQWQTSYYNSYGLVALDYFLSRRVLVDLADDAVYVEELSEPARISVLLTSIVNLPIVVQGEKAAIEPIPGFYPEDAVDEEMNGARLKKIAGIDVGDLIRDIRAGTAAAKLAKLSDAVGKDYDILVVDANGTEREITIPHDETSPGT